MDSHDSIVLAQPSLWGFWKFESFPLDDSSGQSRPAFTSVGGAVSDTLIEIAGGPSIALDGVDDYAHLASNGLSSVTSWTLSMTVEPTANWSTRPGSPALFTHAYTSGTGLPIVLGLSLPGTPAGSLGVGFFNGAWHATGYANPLAVGETYHLLGSWDGTTLRLRVNGIEVASHAPGVTPTANTVHEVRVGRRWDSADHVPMKVSRIAVFTSALDVPVSRDLALSALLRPEAPTQAPEAQAVGLGSSILLRWNPVPNVSQYAVIVDGGPPTLYDFDVTETTLAGAPDTTYNIEVYGLNDYGNGPSSTLAATTTPPPYFDSFNRANSATSPGVPEAGGPYTVRTGTWGITSNALYCASNTAEAHVTYPGLVDFDLTFKVKAPGPNGGVLFRWVDASNTWLFQFTTTQCLLHRRTAGTWHQQGPGYPRPAVAGDVYRVVALGRAIQVFCNGMLIMTVDDHFHAVATSTMGYRFSSDVTTRLDEALVVASELTSISGDLPPLDLGPVEPPYDQTHLYKGRDTKLADEGAVA